MSEEARRTPEEILKQIEEEQSQLHKGKLKIFFGYAAGIGKTYAMLEAAHTAANAGIDVVIGYVEPHTRPETMALTQGLEAIANLEVERAGITLREFDLDAALKRNPKLLLVDELAHNNAEGCRHKKRYQDIKELLNAGIDVYTTVNVQHLEGLNDMVAGITGITVRERIPDSVFDKASQVEMVDIDPAALISRLQQGKVYKENQAQRALNNFFSLDNLVSLREIALRRMADRVNLEQEKRAGSKEKIATAEHILMCLSPSPSNAKVIRQAARMAAAFHGKFTAFYVETPEAANLPKEDAERLKKNITLAEQLGANTVTTYGSDIVEQIAEYAKIAKVSKLVLGRTYTKRSFFSVKESFSDRMTKLSPQLEIFLIPDSFDKKYVKRRAAGRKRIQSAGILFDLAVALTLMVAATGVAFLFYFLGFSDANLIMVYILGVLLTAWMTKFRIVSAGYGILSVFVFNFYFTDPKGTLSVNDPSYFITFFVMFVTAFISSSLTQKVKKNAKQTAKKSYRTELLLETSQLLQQAENEKEIVSSTIRQLGKLLERNIYCYLGNPGENNEPFLYKVKPKLATITAKEELAVAEWTYRNSKHAGYSTTTLPASKCLYLAVRNGEKVYAVVGIEMEERDIPAFENSIMSAILNECALALEKEESIRGQQEAAVTLQQERLRANLLRMISHDLRTPLTSISGNAGILIGNADKIGAEQKQRLYEYIYDDSMWLINLVENLLSVTRIENGTMQLHLQAELMDDVLAEALKHTNRKSEEHKLTIKQEDDMLVAKMDAKLIMQVIINLVDNAVKYTEKGSEITVSTRKEKDDIVIEVSDTGAGIKDAQKERLFDMFYTIDDKIADGHRGMGLGLPLCKSIVKAHGGDITVVDNQPHGTIFRFTLKAEEVKLG